MHYPVPICARYMYVALDKQGDRVNLTYPKKHFPCVGAWWRYRWKHFPRYWPLVQGIHRSLVNSPHKGQWRGALMFSLIYVWTNGWVNNRDAGDLRRNRAHNYVTVMEPGNLFISSGIHWSSRTCKNNKIRCVSYSSSCRGDHISTIVNYSQEAKTKRPPFCKRHFEMHFTEWHNLYDNFTGSCSRRFFENKLLLDWIMSSRWVGDKPLLEPMMASLIMHICIPWLYSVNVVIILLFESLVTLFNKYFNHFD